MHTRIASCALLVGLLLLGGEGLLAQGNAGRIFFPTPETVAIWEFNEFPELVDGTPIPEGTLIPDLTGQGRDAIVEVNAGGDLKVGPGDVTFDDPVGSNRECQRTTFSSHAVRIAVNDDGDVFEMAPEDDFTVELYVNREVVDGGENWGILAGTWHSRNLLDDNVGNPDNDGAWYGFGLIRNDKVGNPGAGGEWSWVMSPVVDGIPRLGFDEAPEQHLAPFFDIPEGRHYVVLTVDRVAQTATAYLDGAQVAQRTVDPTWSFTTPDGWEHARFIMYAGEDDPTRGAYRGSPAGTHLDAVRVQRKAVTVDEVVEVWDNIQSGAPSPAPSDSIRAAVVASSTNVLVGQCARVSGEASYAGGGKTITKYEWKVADGAFEEGGPTREVSFDAPSTDGYEVVLRITNDAAEQSQARLKIKVRHASVTAAIVASVAGVPQIGSTIIVPRGTVLTLDGTTSTTVIPATALVCPLANNEPVTPLPITTYRWDLDGRPLTIEDTRPVFDTAPFATLGEFPISLNVRNDASQQATASLRVKVVEAGRNSNVFGNTPDTVVRFEFNGLPDLADGIALLNDQQLDDLSGNGYHATVEANEVGDLTLGPGSPIYDAPAGESREIQRPLFNVHQARLAINEDGDAFEMAPEDDFTVELFVDRETVVGGPNWGILAGTWHSRNLLDDGAGNPDADGAWYGFGLIRNDKDANPPNEWSWVLSPVVEGVPRLGFDEQPEQHLNPFFDIPLGRHYVVLTVDRVAQTATGYVDGRQVTQRTLDPAWAFTTPDGYEHARFLMFSGEDDPSRGAYRGSPQGTHLDAVRVQRASLTPEEVATNWQKICAGDGTEPSTPVENCTNGTDDDGDSNADCLDSDCSNEPACQRPRFHRGDADDNGQLQLTDAIRILGFLFLGGPAPTCLDAGDADNNDQLQLTDAIRILGFLFLGGPPPVAPGPPGSDCGPDFNIDGLGCLSYQSC